MNAEQWKRAEEDLKFIKNEIPMGEEHKSVFKMCQQLLADQAGMLKGTRAYRRLTSRVQNLRTLARHIDCLKWGYHLDKKGFHQDEKRAEDFIYKEMRNALGKFESIKNHLLVEKYLDRPKPELERDLMNATYACENFIHNYEQKIAKDRNVA